MQKIPHVSTLPFNKQEVKSYTQLWELVGEDMAKDIFEQAVKGDPDWLIDIVNELDYYPNVMVFEGGAEKWFIPLREAGYRSLYFDTDAILKDITDLNNKQTIKNL